MFIVDEDTIAAVQRAYHEGGPWEAVAVLRRAYPIDGDENALYAVQSIARWQPVEPKPKPQPRRRKAAK